jgi:hypothetical protein
MSMAAGYAKVNDIVDWSPLQQRSSNGGSGGFTGINVVDSDGQVAVTQPKAEQEARLVTNGKTRLKRRQLRQLGWTVLSVPYFGFEHRSAKGASCDLTMQSQRAGSGAAISRAVSVVVQKIEERLKSVVREAV